MGLTPGKFASGNGVEYSGALRSQLRDAMIRRIAAACGASTHRTAELGVVFAESDAWVSAKNPC